MVHGKPFPILWDLTRLLRESRFDDARELISPSFFRNDECQELLAEANGNRLVTYLAYVSKEIPDLPDGVRDQMKQILKLAMVKHIIQSFRLAEMIRTLHTL